MADIKSPFVIYSESGSGALVKVRTHTDTMEIVKITGGEVSLIVGTEHFSAKAGDIIFIPSDVVFMAMAKSARASIRGIIFDSKIIEDNMENFDSEIFYMFFIQSKTKIAHFTKDSEIYGMLDKCISDSYDENVSKDVCYKLPIRANIYLLMTALLRYYCGSKDESDKMIYHNVLRLRPVMSYINEKYCEKIYIEKLSEMLGVSSDYFTKMFKDSIGKTPIEYINGLRVNRAMQLLYETALPIAEIAETTGFCNANYFHKIFKQYMETSPLVFRKSVN